MPDDLLIFEFFSMLPVFWEWDILWRIGSILAFLMGIGFEFSMIRGNKKGSFLLC